MKRKILIVSLLLMTTGCASITQPYFQKPTKYKQMPDKPLKGEAPDVTTLSLDASRRLVVSQAVDWQENGTFRPKRITCSEPPPDVAFNALYESALRLSKKDIADLGLESSAQIVALGLANRTSTVEFWRTTSHAYCQILANGFSTEAKEYLVTAASVATLTKDTIKPEQKLKEFQSMLQLFKTTAEVEAPPKTENAEPTVPDPAQPKPDEQ
jgi:hypothetical protein